MVEENLCRLKSGSVVACGFSGLFSVGAGCEMVLKHFFGKRAALGTLGTRGDMDG